MVGEEPSIVIVPLPQAPPWLNSAWSTTEAPLPDWKLRLHQGSSGESVLAVKTTGSSAVPSTLRVPLTVMPGALLLKTTPLLIVRVAPLWTVMPPEMKTGVPPLFQVEELVTLPAIEMKFC